jgi:uncharacterized protein (TIGR03435 family)
MTRVGMSGGPETADPGRITCENMTLRNRVQRAYGLRTYGLSAPDWMSSARFDIVAAAPPNTTTEQARLMWQNLLADRFKLRVHRETKELPLYALVVGNLGLKLTEAPPDDPAAPGSDVRTASGGVSGSSGSASMHMSEEKMTMPMVADFLSRSLDRPVVDETGLRGRYKISLEWQAEDSPASTAEGAAGPSIFTAIQEQLGLKMDPRKGPVEILVLVIDHAEKIPSAN